MDREQMVEIATRALRSAENEFATNARLAHHDRHLAKRVLDAVLPEVTTVAELEAYAPDALVVDPSGLALLADCVIEADFKRGPLTVVWQPEAGAR